MRANHTPFGLELSEFFDVPRSERQANAWDPGASKLIFTVRDLDAVMGRLKARRTPVGRDACPPYLEAQQRTRSFRVNGLTEGRLTQTVMSIPGIEATVVLAEFARPTTSIPAAMPFEWRVQDIGAPQFQLEVAGLAALLDRTARAG